MMNVKYGFTPFQFYGQQPQWTDSSSGDVNQFEQGVYNEEGLGPAQAGAEGKYRMKQVGWSPGGGFYEGKKGLMQCRTDPQTGKTTGDCWYAPVTISGKRAGGVQGSIGGALSGVGGGRSVWDTIMTGGREPGREGFEGNGIWYGADDSGSAPIAPIPLWKNTSFLIGLACVAVVVGVFYTQKVFPWQKGKPKNMFAADTVVPATENVGGIVVPKVNPVTSVPETTQVYGADVLKCPICKKKIEGTYEMEIHLEEDHGEKELLAYEKKTIGGKKGKEYVEWIKELIEDRPEKGMEELVHSVMDDVEEYSAEVYGVEVPSTQNVNGIIVPGTAMGGAIPGTKQI